MDEMHFDDLYECLLTDGFEGIINVGGFPGYRRKEAIPTHTEDGVPIRKLYVTNLPSNITYPDLCKVFGFYGELNHCIFRAHSGRWPTSANSEAVSEQRATQDNSPSHRQPPRTSFNQSPGYAFVTFNRIEDAHKALCAGRSGELIISGRPLIVRPADTWHQPVDTPAHSSINKHIYRRSKMEAPKAVAEVSDPLQEGSKENEDHLSILDILDHDCMQMIFEYLPLPDLIRSERVSKGWQVLVEGALASIHYLSTAKWTNSITTATLRAALMRCGGSLRELHLDSRNTRSLNGRTFKTIARYCPRLEVLSTHGALESSGAAGKAAFASLSNLRSISLTACPRLDDTALSALIEREENPLLELRLDSNENVLGICLMSGNPKSVLALQKLSMRNLNGLRGSFLSSAAPRFASLTELQLDMLPQSCWNALPSALTALPSLSQLEYLSLIRCIPSDEQEAEELAKALSGCKGLKRLRLWYNLLIRDSTLEVVSRNSPGLTWLEVCGCRWITATGARDAIARLENLRVLNISRMALRPIDTGGSVLTTVAGLPHLETVQMRDSPLVTSEDLIELIQTCATLRQLDVCGTMAADNRLMEAVVARCEAADTPPLHLSLARTKLQQDQAPSEEDCHRLQLHLDWRDKKTGFSSLNSAIFENCFPLDDADSDGLEYGEYSDDDGLMDEVSDMFSDSDSDFDVQDLLQNIEWGIYPGFHI